MYIDEISPTLQDIFPDSEIENQSPETWQIQNEKVRILVILSADNSWLRLLTPITPAMQVQSLLPQLLADNFDRTQEVRYALEQGVVWGVFHHRLASLTIEDFQSAIAKLVNLAQTGVSESFNRLIEQRIKQIVKAAKSQGQNLEATYQTLDRFYQEGMLGGVDQDPQQREQFLAAWKYQLERLWNEE
ncbi:MAG: hypothetical protein Tsb0014_24980 [Pleurocapsa sp.]